jgi:antirestriction protein ArdC
VLTLWLQGSAAGFGSGQWATYRQWSESGAQVRKGERGSQVFFWQQRGKAGVASDDGDDRRRLGFVAKAFTVFNADQVDGFTPAAMPTLSERDRDAQAEQFVHNLGAAIEHGGDRAFYSPGYDRIHMPDFGQFRSPSGYYSVLSHELTHWTGAKHRLDRNLSTRFGSADYAMEELIAELGAAFTCAKLGLCTQPRRDHAPYVASWLQALRGDSRAIFTAASKAQEATDFLFSLGHGANEAAHAVEGEAAGGEVTHS